MKLCAKSKKEFKMPRCAVLMCKNDSRSVNVTNGGVSYHRFPKDPHIKEKWIDSTGRGVKWFPKPSNTICSDHFDPKDILLTKKGYKYIKDSAVPTRNILSYHVRIPTEKVKLTTKSHEMALPLEQVKVEGTAGPSRKRASNSTTGSSCAKQKKNAENDDYANSDDDDSIDDDKEKQYEDLTENEKKLDSMLRYEQNKMNKQAIKMKRLQNKLKKLKMTIVDIEDLYKVLEEKLHMVHEDIMILRSTEVKVSELVARRQTNKELSEVVSKLTYSAEFRSFALTLHFISAEAYHYVRKMFKTSLPHPRTLKHWYLRVGGEPGFTKEAYMALKRKADSYSQPILATIVIHDMYVCRSVEVDDKLYGYIDLGTGVDYGDMVAEARQVLALSVTAINGHFKVPVAYFLTSNVTSVQRAELVKLGIEMAHDAGIKIVALSFDGNSDNIHMASHLGCNMEKGRVTFNHPVTEEPIVAILDPSNTLKYLRDALRDYGTLIDKDGNEVEWKFLKQINETLYLSKKLKDMYVDFQNARVKVKLETELFSPKIAEMLQYCRQDLKLVTFKDSEPTQMFVTLCNTFYDVLNSINSHVYGFKNALNRNNADQIFEFLNIASEYVTSLKAKRGDFGPIIRTLKRAFSLVTGIKILYKSLIETNVLKSLPLYKLSHDHLKLLFWKIKEAARSGIDTEPTPKKVIFAYKKVVAQIKASMSNNPPLEQISIPLSHSPVDRINRIAGQDLAKEDNIKDDLDLEVIIETLSHNNEVAVVQIAGYIVQQLIKKINCDVCVEALVTKKRAINNFIVAKDKARLLYPSLDVIKVCKTADMYLRGFDGKKTRQIVKSEVMMVKIMRQFVDTKIFDTISYHQVGEFPESNHVTDLMKAILERYARIHYKVRIHRETYKDILRELKQIWSQPVGTRRAQPRGSIPISFFFQ